MEADAPSRQELVDEIERLRDQSQEHEDRLLRVLADFDNQRKRAAREQEDARKYALQEFVRELLPVRDNLERALDAESAKDGSEGEALFTGIRQTLRLWSDVFAGAGIEEIDPLGQPFDPDFHEALSIRPTSEAEPDTVVEVVQKGYLLNGRLIRPARVIVAAAGDV